MRVRLAVVALFSILVGPVYSGPLSVMEHVSEKELAGDCSDGRCGIITITPAPVGEMKDRLWEPGSLRGGELYLALDGMMAKTSDDMDVWVFAIYVKAEVLPGMIEPDVEWLVNQVRIVALVDFGMITAKVINPVLRKGWKAFTYDTELKDLFRQNGFGPHLEMYSVYSIRGFVYRSTQGAHYDI